jgi:hypothetical protein
MTATTVNDFRYPKYVKIGSNANLSSSQAQKVINYVKGKYAIAYATVSPIGNKAD